MSSAINTALSGLNAASKRLENSANNIANQFSTSTSLNGVTSNTPYVPTDIDQVSLSAGGVQALVKQRENATTQAYDPTNPAANEDGLVTYPNVDTAQELISQQVAAYDFKANLKTIKVADEMQQSLLDIIS